MEDLSLELVLLETQSVVFLVTMILFLALYRIDYVNVQWALNQIPFFLRRSGHNRRCS